MGWRLVARVCTWNREIRGIADTNFRGRLGRWLEFVGTVERARGEFLSCFGTIRSVPCFYSMINFGLIPLLALLVHDLYRTVGTKLSSARRMANTPKALEYGFGLWGVYIVWIVIIAIVYPLCKRYDVYKMNHREKWWLSYL